MALLNKELRVQEGRLVHRIPVGFKIDQDRIWFERTPFNKVLNRCIKTFKGYKWHGFQDPPIKKWSIKNCSRNVFQLKYLWGENVYDWFERPLEMLEESEFNRPQFEELGLQIKGQQIDMVSRALTYHYQIWGAEQGLGKSLSFIETAERSGVTEWWYVGPKSALASVELDIKKWGMDPRIKLKMMSYQALIKLMRYDFEGLIAPDGVVFDECTAMKNPTTHTAQAAQALADLIREQHGLDGYVLALSGTPSAKHPTDLWSQCEVVWPGYLKEGEFRAFEKRYAVMQDLEKMDGTVVMTRVGWKEEEVARLPNRYKGLMTVYRKEDWLDLPEKVYVKKVLVPSKKVLRVAKSLCHVAPNTITALTWCRALSSGFQYINTQIGDKECPVCNGTGVYEHPEMDTCPGCAGAKTIADYERQTRRVKTPKDGALRDILDDNEAHGRLVVAASFQGSIDRILGICKSRGWAVACVDGRGWRSYDNQGGSINVKPLDLWEEYHGKVCFVCNPGSARFGLTLTLAHTLVFYDNNFSAEHRLQMEDRIHRMSMDLILGATIIDLVHLPIDQLVIDTLTENKKLEHLSLGLVSNMIKVEDDCSQELLELETV